MVAPEIYLNEKRKTCSAGMSKNAKGYFASGYNCWMNGLERQNPSVLDHPGRVSNSRGKPLMATVSYPFLSVSKRWSLQYDQGHSPGCDLNLLRAGHQKSLSLPNGLNSRLNARKDVLIRKGSDRDRPSHLLTHCPQYQHGPGRDFFFFFPEGFRHLKRAATSQCQDCGTPDALP